MEHDNEDGANDQTNETKPVKSGCQKFKCPYCVSKFSQKHNLEAHIKKKHENYTDNNHDEKKKHSCPHGVWNSC